MKTFADAILTVEKFSTKKEKFEALSGLDDAGVRLLFETENPYRVFGIKKWDAPEAYASTDPSFDQFFRLLDLLADRTLTGNAAKNAVTATLGMYTERTASVLQRVLKKDLKCGANTTTFEAIYPQLKVPFMDLMLCGKIEHLKNDKGEIIYPKYNWRFPCLGEVKYDGARLIAVVDGGVVEYLSRSGKPADQWNGLFDDDLIAMERAIGQPIVVDGEALSLGGFQATSKAKGSKNDKSGMRFFAFDMMALSCWKNQDCPTVQLQRTIRLESLIAELKLTKIIKSKSKVLNNLDEAKAFYTEVIELGLPGQDEGLIIKDINGKYEWNSKKRTLTWAKWKPVIDVDVTIVDFYFGSKGTKNEFRLGGFNVEGEDENGNKIKGKCGGFKVNSKKFKDWIAKFDKEHKLAMNAAYDQGISKDEFFRTLAVQKFEELFKGKTCTIETQELSLAENSTTYALRFPQFICLRDDK